MKSGKVGDEEGERRVGREGDGGAEEWKTGENWESGRLGKEARGERLGARGVWWEDWETGKTWEIGRLRKARGKAVEGAVGLESYALLNTRYWLLFSSLPATRYSLLSYPPSGSTGSMTV